MMAFEGQQQSCSICQLPAFPEGTVSYNQSLFHQSCFKCSACNILLTPSTVHLISNQIFCEDHAVSAPVFSPALAPIPSISPIRPKVLLPTISTANLGHSDDRYVVGSRQSFDTIRSLPQHQHIFAPPTGSPRILRFSTISGALSHFQQLSAFTIGPIFICPGLYQEGISIKNRSVHLIGLSSDLEPGNLSADELPDPTKHIIITGAPDSTEFAPNIIEIEANDKKGKHEYFVTLENLFIRSHIEFNDFSQPTMSGIKITSSVAHVPPPAPSPSTHRSALSPFSPNTPSSSMFSFNSPTSPPLTPFSPSVRVSPVPPSSPHYPFTPPPPPPAKLPPPVLLNTDFLNCRISNCGFGVSIFNPTSNVVIKNSIITDCHRDGVKLVQGSLVLSSSFIFYSKADGIVASGAKLSIDNSSIDHNNGNGLSILNKSNLNVCDSSTFDHNGCCGAKVSESRVNISNCQFMHNGHMAAMIAQKSRGKIFGSHFCESDCGLYLDQTFKIDVEECSCDSNKANGVVLKPARDREIEYRFTNVGCDANLQHGFLVASDGASSRKTTVVMSKCYTNNCGKEGFKLTGNLKCEFDTCKAMNSRRHGFCFDPDTNPLLDNCTSVLNHGDGFLFLCHEMIQSHRLNDCISYGNHHSGFVVRRSHSNNNQLLSNGDHECFIFFEMDTCVAHSNALNGFEVSSSGWIEDFPCKVYFSTCFASHSGKNGFCFAAKSDAILHQCKSYVSKGFGFVFERQSQVHVTSCSAQKCGDPGFSFADRCQGKLMSSHVDSSSRSGFTFGYCADILAINCVASSCHPHGFHIDPLSQPKLKHCHSIGSGRVGIMAHLPYANILEHCFIDGQPAQLVIDKFQFKLIPDVLTRVLEYFGPSSHSLAVVSQVWNDAFKALHGVPLYPISEIYCVRVSSLQEFCHFRAQYPGQRAWSVSTPEAELMAADSCQCLDSLGKTCAAISRLHLDEPHASTLESISSSPHFSTLKRLSFLDTKRSPMAGIAHSISSSTNFANISCLSISGYIMSESDCTQLFGPESRLTSMTNLTLNSVEMTAASCRIILSSGVFRLTSLNLAEARRGDDICRAITDHQCQHELKHMVLDFADMTDSGCLTIANCLFPDLLSLKLCRDRVSNDGTQLIAPGKRNFDKLKFLEWIARVDDHSPPELTPETDDSDDDEHYGYVVFDGAPQD